MMFIEIVKSEKFIKRDRYKPERLEQIFYFNTKQSQMNSFYPNKNRNFECYKCTDFLGIYKTKKATSNESYKYFYFKKKNGLIWHGINLSALNKFFKKYYQLWNLQFYVVDLKYLDFLRLTQ